MKVTVSYLKSDDYKKCIEKINQTSADYLHVDMCDGKYVEAKAQDFIGEYVGQTAPKTKEVINKAKKLTGKDQKNLLKS